MLVGTKSVKLFFWTHCIIETTDLMCILLRWELLNVSVSMTNNWYWLRRIHWLVTWFMTYSSWFKTVLHLFYLIVSVFSFSRREHCLLCSCRNYVHNKFARKCVNVQPVIDHFFMHDTRNRKLSSLIYSLWFTSILVDGTWVNCTQGKLV